MKKVFQIFFTLAILGLTAVSASAQPPAGGRVGGRTMDPEQRAERQSALMQDSLSLSDDLTAEVKEVLLVYAKKMQEARAEANGDRESMRASMQTLRQEQDEELKAMLGEEQWTKWEAIRAEMWQSRQRGPGGQGTEKGNNTKKEKKKDTKTE